MRPIIEYRNAEALRFFLEHACVSVVYVSASAYASLVPDEIAHPLRAKVPQVLHAAAALGDLQELRYAADYREAAVFAKTRLLGRVATEPSEHAERLRFIWDDAFKRSYYALVVGRILQCVQSIPAEPREQGRGPRPMIRSWYSASRPRRPSPRYGLRSGGWFRSATPTG